MTIQEKLLSMQDLKYKESQTKLIPNISAESVMGIRTPHLRVYAKELMKTDAADEFLTQLPHQYFDENQLHAFIISEMKDYDVVLAALEKFLPYVDNWATCDQLRPKVFKKYPDKLITAIRAWLASTETYTIRFGIGMLMCHYLDENFKPEYLEWAANIRSEEYYISMMLAWYFATALAKQYDATIPYIENNRFSTWVHNKTIQKARESYRITDEQKAYLKSLKK